MRPAVSRPSLIVNAALKNVNIIGYAGKQQKNKRFYKKKTFTIQALGIIHSTART